MSLQQKVELLAAELNLGQVQSLVWTMGQAVQALGINQEEVGSMAMVEQANVCLQMLDHANTVADTLRRELSIEGTAAEVADTACRLLELSTDGESHLVMKKLEAACVQTTGTAPGDKARVEAASRPVPGPDPPDPPPLRWGGDLEYASDRRFNGGYPDGPYGYGYGRNYGAYGGYNGYYGYYGGYGAHYERSVYEEERIRHPSHSAAGRRWRRDEHRDERL